MPSGYLRDCRDMVRALLSDRDCHCTVPKFPVYINRYEIVFTGAAIVKDLFLSWVVCQKDDSEPQTRVMVLVWKGLLRVWHV